MSDILTSRIVNVQFSAHDSRTYAYFTDDETIQTGDLVVVISPNNRGDDAFPVFGTNSEPAAAPALLGHAKIVRVVSTEETVESIERVREWVVAKLGFDAYADRRAREEKRRILGAKIKRARQEALEAFEMAELAAKSPALQALLDEMAKL